jgi:hypothetical protein
LTPGRSSCGHVPATVASETIIQDDAVPEMIMEERDGIRCLVSITARTAAVAIRHREQQ